MINRRWSLVRHRIAILTVACAAVSHASVIQAAPVFYLSTQNTGATPGNLSLINQAPNSMGTLFLWTNSDVRLSGIDLELQETGGGIKFTGAEWLNPSSRWALTGTPAVTNSLVSLLQGGAIPLVVGGGVGPGSPGTDAGPNVLLGSINYMTLTGGTSQLSLRVGGQTIADWDGNAPNVHFGTASNPAVPGGVPGGMGAVGSIGVEGPEPLPPVVVDANLGDREQGSVIGHTFTTSIGDPPITWGNLIASGPGPLANAPSLTANGVFNWNSAGSPLGLYNFDVTATGFGSDVGRLSLNLVGQVPEPPVVVDFVTGGDPGETILHTFQTSAGDTPITWSNLVSVGPATPVNLPQLTANGMFSWDSTGSPPHEYIFRVTATNAAGSDSGELIIGLGGEPRIPEPATATLLGLALVVGVAGTVRRRR